MKGQEKNIAVSESTEQNNSSELKRLVMLPTKPFRHLDLFSGIGGFAFAAKSIYKERYENIGFCEIEKFCHTVLRKNFGEAVSIYEDIKELDGTIFNNVDLLTGGFPCQDISAAGKRVGLKGRRSGLFYEMLRVIEQSKPRYIIYENSSLVMGDIIKTIHRELKEIGYDNTGRIFTARQFGFPHKRERYYGVSVAHSCGVRWYEIENELRHLEENSQQELYNTRKNRYAEFTRTFSRALQTPSNSDILRTFDGVPSKLDSSRIKALGNAIIPQIAELLLAALKTVDDSLVKLCEVT